MRSIFGSIFRRFRGDNNKSLSNISVSQQQSTFFNSSPIKNQNQPSTESAQTNSVIPQPQVLSPSYSKTRSDFSLRSVKKRASITPEQFRKSLENIGDEPQTPLSSLMLSPNSSLMRPYGSTKKTTIIQSPANKDNADDLDKTEEIFDFEKSATQTPIKRKTTRIMKNPLQPPIRLVITPRMKQGEIEKQYALGELSKLKKANQISSEVRDQIFTMFASQLDHYNQKKSKEDQLQQQRESKDKEQSDASKKPEEIMNECSALLANLQNETQKWNSVQLPTVSIIDDQPTEDELIPPEPVSLSTQNVEDITVGLDKLSLVPQTLVAKIMEIEENQKDVAVFCHQISNSQADPLRIVMSTKVNE